MRNPPNQPPKAAKLQVVTDTYTPPKPTKASRSARRLSDRDRWIAQVGRSPQITDSVRAFLLFLACCAMDEDGFTAVKQEEIAARMGKTVRRIYDRYRAAVEAGFLIELGRGGAGGVVRYQAVIPTLRQGTSRDAAPAVASSM